MDPLNPANLAFLLMAITAMLGGLLIWMFWTLQSAADDDGRHDGRLTKAPVRRQ